VFKLDASGQETVLHTFTGAPDGRNPNADLILDEAGNLYGTTAAGGISGICPPYNGCGTAYMLDRSGKETVLYRFDGGADGSDPSWLVRDAAGNLYGTTTTGGSYGHGTVFKLDTTGKDTWLYSFTGGADGDAPNAGLVRDVAGSFYGTTFVGGAYGYGTVFTLDATGKETVLYSFMSGPDAHFP